jgi:F-type H+-transporting ATPase subunit b
MRKTTALTPRLKHAMLRALPLFLIVLGTAAPALAQDVEKSAEYNPGLLDIDMLSVIWVIAIFIVLAIILYRTAWKNVLAGLKGREQRIRKDIADAETARLKAEATLKEYNQQLATAEQKARDILSKAATDAEAIATQIRARAQQEAEETKERAIKDIEGARDQALSEIYERTAELSTAVAEKILRRNLNANDQRDLVDQSLRELQTVGA